MTLCLLIGYLYHIPGFLCWRYTISVCVGNEKKNPNLTSMLAKVYSSKTFWCSSSLCKVLAYNLKDWNALSSLTVRHTANSQMQPALTQVLPCPCSRCPVVRVCFRSLALQTFNKAARVFSGYNSTAPPWESLLRVLLRVCLKAGALASSGPRDQVLALSRTSWGALGESWGSPFCKMEVRSPALRMSWDNARFLGMYTVSGVQHILQQHEPLYSNYLEGKSGQDWVLLKTLRFLIWKTFSCCFKSWP